MGSGSPLSDPARQGDPEFPAVAEQLKLMGYWKASGTRPDVCNEKAAPEFCRML